jgi:hypothetical protein
VQACTRKTGTLPQSPATHTTFLAPHQPLRTAEHPTHQQCRPPQGTPRTTTRLCNATGAAVQACIMHMMCARRPDTGTSVSPITRRWSCQAATTQAALTSPRGAPLPQHTAVPQAPLQQCIAALQLPRCERRTQLASCSAHAAPPARGCAMWHARARQRARACHLAHGWPAQAAAHIPITLAAMRRRERLPTPSHPPITHTPTAVTAFHHARTGQRVFVRMVRATPTTRGLKHNTLWHRCALCAPPPAEGGQHRVPLGCAMPRTHTHTHVCLGCDAVFIHGG